MAIAKKKQESVRRWYMYNTCAAAYRRVSIALLTTHSPVQGSAGKDWTDSTWIKLVSGFTEPNCTSSGNIRERLPIARRGRFKELDLVVARADFSAFGIDVRERLSRRYERFVPSQINIYFYLG